MPAAAAIEEDELDEHGLVENEDLRVEDVQQTVEEFFEVKGRLVEEEAAGVAERVVDEVEQQQHLVVDLARHLVVEVEELGAVGAAGLRIDLHRALQRHAQHVLQQSRQFLS